MSDFQSKRDVQRPEVGEGGRRQKSHLGGPNFSRQDMCLGEPSGSALTRSLWSGEEIGRKGLGIRKNRGAVGQRGCLV